MVAGTMGLASSDARAVRDATGIDYAAIAAHGIGRGDFAALVFAGSRAALGDIAGHYTWNTARKFVLEDPRLPASEDFARVEGSALGLWPTDRVRPTPGVCFVFADGTHPAVAELRSRGADEFENFVILPRLTVPALLRRRVGRVVDAAGERPIVLLGFGDQGRRIGAMLAERGSGPGPLLIVESDPARTAEAERLGFVPAKLDDARLDEAAIVCSPLMRPRSFAAVIEAARSSGRPVMDNSLGWDDRPELRTFGRINATGAAARSLRFAGDAVLPQDHGLGLGLRVIRRELRRVSAASVAHLNSGQVARLGHRAGEVEVLNLATPPAESPLAHLTVSYEGAFVAIDGQSNHHDAAFAILSTRAFLRAFPSMAATVDRVMPAETRQALGATALERTVIRTTTGRSLASPFMTACEQTAIGVLAAAYATDSPIVEIGSAIGGSTLLMAAATDAGQGCGPEIWSVDPDAPTRHVMRALFEVEGYAGRLRQVVKTSNQAIVDLAGLRGRAGLVFIDGLHTEAAASNDFANYAELVRPGGCIAFHDVDARFAGIFRVVAERVVADRRFRPLCMVDTIAAFERLG